MECPFCDEEVIKRQLVYENESLYLLHNLRPATRGQCLIVPKRHVTNIRELNRRELVGLMDTIQYVSARLIERLNPIGMNYGANEGEWAGQSVSHFHFHIMPRFGDDKVPEYHLFHRDPRTKRDLTERELEPLVLELRRFFA